ncbi:MAG TPA: 50S ribosomal protein L25 [bacterium]|nr:50S ribosomal protein L25 [bacterium]
MERISLAASPRVELGKNAVKRVRQAGLVPAVLYGRGRTPVALTVDRKALLGALRTEAGRNVLIDLRVKLNGEETTDTVMVAEIQHDHLRHEVLHVDLHQISLTDKIEARVPVVLTGVPEGVAASGGILEQHLREVLVRCLPTAIPEHVTVSVEALRIGASLHVRDLPVDQGLEIVTAPEEVIAAVVAPKAEEVAAPVEGAAATEPELVGKEPGAEAEGEAKAEPAARAEAKAPKADAKPAKADKKE